MENGWQEGRAGADHILEANFNRLTRDYRGMVLYSELLRQGFITRPRVSDEEQTVSGNRQKLVTETVSVVSGNMLDLHRINEPGSPLLIRSHIMNLTKPSDFTLYDFKGVIDAETFKNFLVWASTKDVSDIHIQGGNQIVVSRYGRLLYASTLKLADDQLSMLVNEVFGPEVRAKIRGGNPQDRALQLDGDQQSRYGLTHGERIRFRCNFVQATAGRIDSTTAVTMRVIPTEIPNLEMMGLESDLFDALLPQGLGLVGVKQVREKYLAGFGLSLLRRPFS